VAENVLHGRLWAGHVGVFIDGCKESVNRTKKKEGKRKKSDKEK
jgi:hypothetical protein